MLFRSYPVIETSLTNNLGTRVTKDFLESMHEGFVWIQGQYLDANGNAVYVTHASDLDDDLQWMNGAFPFRDVINQGLAVLPVLAVNQFDLTTGDGWSAAVRWIDTLHDDCDSESDPFCAQTWVYVIPQDTPGCCGGIIGITNAIGGNTIIVQDINHPSILAHEMGHHYGLWHGECGLPADDPYPDPSIPLKIEDYGLNVETLRIFKPGVTDEFMTYCTDQVWDNWISIHSYDFIYDSVMQAREAATTAEAAT